MEQIEIINSELQGLNSIERLQYLANKFQGKIVFSTSFGQEDQVITDMIFRNDLPVEVFTLDTGRLFEETYSLFSRTRKKYGKTIKAYFPNQEKVEDLLLEKGPESFYHSVENRKECCFIRKVEPLKRALNGRAVWITGLRAGQSDSRSNLPQVEWDEQHQLIKYHPVLSWSLDEVQDYLSVNRVPYNPLHDKGFVSIGCAPCTRAISPGEDIRAGRWWWESSKKECGLHQ
ncbi:phosphoadenylyl-sulfate reductase [Xanthovirga aplysinae]|uniref:phosphoadenylyl-sulfate reductase n=1 Tax=Xanthovirga aplysinae TaxID=2529853 RepID=UPI0012BC7CCF|nr:phosphoadenylyl-sulfate reductase [Xanthovirga aplysinae]